MYMPLISHQWPLAPMLVGIGQQESPVWGVVNKETLLSAQQLSCDTAQLKTEQPAVEQLWARLSEARPPSC